MAQEYESSSYNVEKLVQQEEVFPFIEQGDETTKMYILTYRVNRDYYEKIPLDTVYSEDDSAILVDQSSPTDIKGGVVEFTRTYSYVPESRFEYAGITWAMPGIEKISGYSWTADSTPEWTGTAWKINLTGDVSAIQVGWRLRLGYEVTTSSKISAVKSYPVTVTGKSGSDIFIDRLPFGNVTNITSIKITSARRDLTRLPRSVIRVAEWNFEYVNTSDPIEEVPISDAFIIINPSNLEETDTITSSTIPTNSDWQSWVDDRAKIQIEPAQVVRWKGNIYEIKYPMVEVE